MKKAVIVLIFLMLLFTACSSPSALSEDFSVNDGIAPDGAASVPSFTEDGAVRTYEQGYLVKGAPNYGVTYLWLNDTDILLCAVHYDESEYTSTLSILNTDTNTVTFVESLLTAYCNLFSSVQTETGFLFSDFSGNEYALSSDASLSVNTARLKEEDLSSFYDVYEKVFYAFDYKTNCLMKTVKGTDESLYEFSLAENEHIACIRTAPDQSALIFAVMKEFYSDNTVIYDLKTDNARIISVVLGLPAYFWLDDAPVALSFDENRDGVYALLLRDGRLAQEMKLCDENSSVDFSSGTYQYGAATNRFPFVLRTQADNQLMLLSLENDVFQTKEIVQTTSELSQPQLSKDGKKVAYFLMANPQGAPRLVVRTLQ